MRVSTALLIGTSLLAVAAPATAQTAQEEAAQAINPPATAPTPGPEPTEGAIIVTATKRASTVQEVPFSVNAQTEQDIQRANAQTLEDISRNVAGLAVQNLGPGQSQVSVRGVSAGQIVRDQPGVKEQVGVYLDESVISLSLFTPDIDLFDLNRVETLRGPQGTLFGSGSVGGTIRYITNQPKLDRFEGQLEAGINVAKGGDVGYLTKAALNLPMGRTAAIRGVVYNTHFPGFIDSVGTYRRNNVNDGDRYGGRLALLLEPTPDIRITPRVLWQRATANGFNREEIFNLYANPLTTTRPAYTFERRQQYLLRPERFRDETVLGDLTASVGFGLVELTSVTSYIHRDILVSRDASALTGSISDDIGLPDAAVLLPSNLRDTTKLDQFTQEVRLASTGSGPLQWVIGAFYSNVDRDYAQRLPTPGYDAFIGTVTGGVYGPDSPYNSDLAYNITQKALFGEGSYKFNQFKLTAGGRYYKFNEDRTFVSGGIFSGDDNLRQKTKSDGFSPRVIGSWEPNRNLSVNLQAAKGFRLGGSNDPLNTPICSPQDLAIFGPFATAYDDETLWNYEGGVKYSRGGITFNAAAFYTRIRDLQVTVDAGSCSSRLVFNVPKAHTKGIEAEFNARPLPGLDLSLAANIQEAEFDSTLPGALAVSTGIRKGNRLPSVPKYQIAGSATYTTRALANADWFSTASVQRIGNRYTQPSDQENNPRLFVYGNNFGGIPTGVGTTVNLLLPAYTLVNVSTGLAFDNGLEVVAYVNNLFDKDPKLSFDRERGGRARLGYNVGQPRIMGLTLRKSFGHRVTPLAPAYVAPPAPIEAAPVAPQAPMAPPPPPPVQRGQRG
ncbi:MAG TPA: TonB-dependent receptor [Sphingomicrobium sp.]|nr:TonB-dependent receptor [Sphingomicrobium sp.]